MIPYKLLLVDIDGVVWIDGDPISDNIQALKRLEEEGVTIIYLTNNSTRSRRSYADKLKKLGLNASDRNIVNSGFSAALWLHRKMGEARVLPVGEEGLAEELILQGHRLLIPKDYQDADAVVVGLDRGLSYMKLEAASLAIQEGALFIATNRDNVYPTSRGLSPGAGSIVAMLETAAGRRVDFDAGKPNPWIIEAALSLLDAKPAPGEVAVVGDRVDTDMELARRAGVDGILVLTGVSAARSDKLPPGVRVVRTLKDLL